MKDFLADFVIEKFHIGCEIYKPERETYDITYREFLKYFCDLKVITRHNLVKGFYRRDNCEEMKADSYLKHYYKNILKWYRLNKDELIKFWNETRPGNCPVGKI